MANFSQLLAINDPQALGEEYSRKAIEDAKIQAQTQVNKESKAFNIANAIVGGVTAYMTGGGSLLAAGAGALGAPRGGLKPISSLTGGAIAGTGLKSITGGATGIENELSALSTTKNFGKTAELLGGITGDQTMLEAGRNIGKLQAVETKAADELEKEKQKILYEKTKEAKKDIDPTALGNQQNMYTELTDGITSGKLTLTDALGRIEKHNTDINMSKYNDATKKDLFDNNKAMVDKLTSYDQKIKDQAIERAKKSEKDSEGSSENIIGVQQMVAGKNTSLSTDIDAVLSDKNAVLTPKQKEDQINKRTLDTVMYFDQVIEKAKADKTLSDKEKLAIAKEANAGKTKAQSIAKSKISGLRAKIKGR